ncbi:MAPK-activated protein kinase Srk1 [Malassezia vespertilionis]|uniref:Protein kinase domain-containing protein n=1 Tax=Malassezia vespertilionis TaxID=2020962 RepID=A0A2N1JEN6_9BASI|nr:MAPK-activated protein kinase Srk1 [Malassezia vespertilionis]PKI85011.1 hypothetical protein MVES_001125 [Malassezia vespertilionis]WFD05858.1 MAPK-activated protein kinase Srk1 [Malassezia vespertilionis]
MSLERIRQFLRHGKAAAGPFPNSFKSEEKIPGSNASPMALSMSQATTAPAPATTPVPTIVSPVRTPDAEGIADGIDKQKRTKVCKADLERIVAEEREAATHKNLPDYPGLPDRFILTDKIGDGTFSMVYKAIARDTGEEVAVKVVRKQKMRVKTSDAVMREQNKTTERAAILKEVQIMRRLEHPSIVKLLSFTESDEHCFLVMELLDGGELFEQIVKLTYLSEDLARHVIVQVAQGIQFMHRNGIVHRDIKPENLLFNTMEIVPSDDKIEQRPYNQDKADEGKFIPHLGGGGIKDVKIADFGLSKVVWEQHTKTPCGTVGYAAPEIVRDQQYTKSVDMWALGCVLYTLLCGFPPFYDESIKVLTQKVSKGQYTFLSPWWDDISDAAKDVISNLLTVDVSQRFTIDQFLAHEWCQTSAPPAHARKEERSVIPVSLDSPLLASMHSREFSAQDAGRWSNSGHLREAIDVSFAAHRIEEEMRRKDGAWRDGNVESDAQRDAATVRFRHGHAAAKAILDRHNAHAPKNAPSRNANSAFVLSMDGASILERRRRAVEPKVQKQRTVPHVRA